MMMPLFSRCDTPEVLEVIYHFLCQRTRGGRPLLEKFGKMTIVRHPDQEPELVPKKNKKCFGPYMPTGPQPGPVEYVLDYGDEDHRAKVENIAAGKVNQATTPPQSTARPRSPATAFCFRHRIRL